jgi:hypothetical protein
MRILALAVSTVILALMAGCQSMKMKSISKAVASPAPCPAGFQGEVRIAASAVPWKMPADLAQRDGLNPVLGRRILVSVSPRGEAYGMHIASSELALTPLGGTFRGWAQISGSSKQDGLKAVEPGHETAVAQASGIEVTPGRLRITPFLHTSKLQPQTMLLDVILAPGAEPLDEMVISAGVFWDASRHPLPPEQIKLSLEPLRHFTVYDRVDGIVSSTFTTAPPSASSETTQCTAETRVALIDRDSTAPPLWDLRKSAPTGRSEWWLALFDPQTGSHRVVFKNPAAADGFASWLRQTHALLIGRYRVGVFRPGYSNDALRTVPEPHSITDTFQAASAEDLDDLVVGRLGEI